MNLAKAVHSPFPRLKHLTRCNGRIRFSIGYKYLNIYYIYNQWFQVLQTLAVHRRQRTFRQVVGRHGRSEKLSDEHVQQIPETKNAVRG